MLCACGCDVTAHIYGSQADGWTCFLHLLTCPTVSRPVLTLGTQEYPVSAQALKAVEDERAAVAAGLIDATQLLVAILTVEGYGDDVNVRAHAFGRQLVPGHERTTMHRTLTMARIIAAIQDGSDSPGFCVSCGADAYGVEPDTRQYPCDECGEEQVFGAEELLIMGLP